MSPIEENLADVRLRMAQAAIRSERDVSSIKLVAVSKQHSVESIMAAYDAGQRCFGESRAQELVGKVRQLPDDIEWHFIGPLQRNKVNQVRPLVSLLHSLDRTTLASSWGRVGQVPALLQFRLGGEPTKAGFEPDDLPLAMEDVLAAGVPISGVMSIPPPEADVEATRGWFRFLRKLSEQLTDALPSASVISMGMSHDFETAIEEGATLIRVGSAIFGSR